MPANPVTALSTALGIAAANAGLTILSSEEGIDFNGRPTAIFRIGLSPDAPAERTLRLELSEDFDFNRPELLPEMTSALARRGQTAAQSAAGCLRDHGRHADHLQRLPLALPPLCLGRGYLHRPRGGPRGRRHRFPAARQDFRQHDRDLCGDCPCSGAALCGDLHLQRDSQDPGPGPTRTAQERQSPAGSGDHALLQPLAKEVFLHRHR
jgi:hypothetical protein